MSKENPLVKKFFQKFLGKSKHLYIFVPKNINNKQKVTMEKMTRSLINDLLSMFVSKDNDRRTPWIIGPYIVGEYVCATNSYQIIRISKEYLSAAKEKEYKKNVAEKDIVWPDFKERNKVTIGQIKEAIERIPLIEEVEKEEIETECPECNGSGEVTWTYTADNGEEFERRFECPVCDGNGEITEHREIKTGKTGPQLDYIIKIKDIYINAKAFIKIYEALKRCDANQVEIGTNFEDHRVLFHVTNDIEIMAASIMCDPAPKDQFLELELESKR